MRLVERDHEIAVLKEILRHSAAGAGRVALVSGGVGCGKTALLAEAGVLAAERGFAVHTAAGSTAERQSPGAVLARLLRDVELPPADREALARFSAPGPAESEAAVTHVLQRLCSAVERVAAGTPLLLAIDDVQFMDAVSVEWTLLLLRRLPSARLTLVLSEGVLSRPADPRLRAELLRHPGHRPLALRRLSLPGVALVLSQRLPFPAAQAMASRCHAISGGNPLLVLALADDNRPAPAPAAVDPPTVGDAFLDAVTGCLHRGWPALLRIARALAVLHDDSIATELVAGLAEVDETVLTRGLRALDAAGLLAGDRPRHESLRTAALVGLTGGERGALHRRAAIMLYGRGAPATEVARHLLAAEASDPPWAAPQPREAAEPSDLTWAVAQLCEAGERHLAASRPAEAQPCFEAALRACADAAARLRIKALLAGTAWVLNPSVGARHLTELAAAVRDGRLPAHYSLMLAKYLLWHGRYDEAADAVKRIGRGGHEPDPAAAAEARATRELLSATYPAVVSGREPATARHRTALPGDPRTRGAAALTDVLRHGSSPAAIAAAQASMRAMHLGRSTHEWLTCAVSALLFADRIQEAADWCDHWLAEAGRRRVPLWIAEFSSVRAGIALRQGDPRRARELAETALSTVPPESWGVCVGGPLANLIQAGTDIGDHVAASVYLQTPLPEGIFHSRFGLYYLHARGSHYLASGQHQAALDDFVDCGELMGRWGFDQPAFIPWRSSAARALLALGDVTAASKLARAQLELAGDEFTRTRAISLSAVAAASRPAQRVGPLTSAVAILEETGDRVQLAWALADLSTGLAWTGHTDRAEQALDRAARLARECGAADPVTGVRSRWPGPAANPAGRPAASPAAGGVASRLPVHLLSPAEQRVAALAGQGHTNREISRRLGITASTVEQHLTRIFRKLGVRTRDDLRSGDVRRAAGSAMFASPGLIT